MSQQAMPFFDSAEAATKHAIEASGKNLKEVGSRLWPDKSPDAARTALANALNETRAERLTSDQHLLVANYCHRYDWLYYNCLKASHSQPQLMLPAERLAQLQAGLFTKSDELQNILAAINSLRGELEGKP